MPIYAYRCEGCGFQKDALQKLSDSPLVDCPQCGQPKFVKQVTAAGFALKGTGWYVTDFRDSAKKPSGTPAPAATAPNTAPTTAPAAASESPAGGASPTATESVSS